MVATHSTSVLGSATAAETLCICWLQRYVQAQAQALSGGAQSVCARRIIWQASRYPLQQGRYEQAGVSDPPALAAPMQVLAAAREQELQERVVFARGVLEHFDRKVNDPETPQSPLMHFLDGLLKVSRLHSTSRCTS